MCDGSGRVLRGVVGVRADRTSLVDFLRQENEAVTGRESVSLAMQDAQIRQFYTASQSGPIGEQLEGAYLHNADCLLQNFTFL